MKGATTITLSNKAYELLCRLADRLAHLSDYPEELETDDLIDMHCYVLDIINSLKGDA